MRFRSERRRELRGSVLDGDPDKKRWYVRGDRVPSQLEKFISIKEYLAEPYEPDYLSRYSYFGFEKGLSMSVMCQNYYGFELMPKTNRGRVFIDGGSTSF